MNYEALLDDYQKQAKYHSFAHMMLRVPEAAFILAEGHLIVPSILKRLKTSPSMSYQTLLSAITNHWPAEATEQIGNGFASFSAVNVARSAELWIEWGIKQGYIQS